MKSLCQPKVIAALDPDFQPAVLFNRDYIEAAKKSGNAMPLVIGLEGECGRVARFETVVRAQADAETLRFAERTVKFLLWAIGGWKITVGGPERIGTFIKKTYSRSG